LGEVRGVWEGWDGGEGGVTGDLAEFGVPGAAARSAAVDEGVVLGRREGDDIEDKGGVGLIAGPSGGGKGVGLSAAARCRRKASGSRRARRSRGRRWLRAPKGEQWGEIDLAAPSLKAAPRCAEAQAPRRVRGRSPCRTLDQPRRLASKVGDEVGLCGTIEERREVMPLGFSLTARRSSRLCAQICSHYSRSALS
jgi:hypothetical protein